jgi:hypothetical protein
MCSRLLCGCVCVVWRSLSDIGSYARKVMRPNYKTGFIYETRATAGMRGSCGLCIYRTRATAGREGVQFQCVICGASERRPHGLAGFAWTFAVV